MRASLIAAAVLLAALPGCSPWPRDEQEPAPTGGPASADPGARSLADSVVQAAGGWKGWEASRYLEFTFVVSVEGTERRRTRHCWDRYTGDSRVEAVDQEGRKLVVVWNEKTGQGEARREGRPLAGEELAGALDQAKRMLVNDSYWLIAPFKLHDPGVHLADGGAETDSTGRAWRVIALSFDPGTGLTSRDRYWVFVEPGTGRVGRWDYILESAEPGSAPMSFAWSEPRPMGGVRLPQEKVSADGRIAIRFEEVSGSPAPRADAFAF
jgi:hypothetical protein